MEKEKCLCLACHNNNKGTCIHYGPCTSNCNKLPRDRWGDAEDFITMMAKLKARLKRDNLAVESFSFLDLPKAFNQYQVEIGK